MENIDGNLFCTFVTDLGQDYEIPKNKHNLPSSTSNEELSAILQNLLENYEKQSMQSFDFLINGELLLGTIKSHMSKLNLVGERNIEILYTQPVGKPQIESTLDVTNGIARLFWNNGELNRKSKSCCSKF